ncbi:uncharacterized protein BROUX77_001511 [Berkeleyomyces rouxiae]|uniref:uncharacterized protein n=1 Tax=Berkeleyomyces rouxiae TaxID=2035830 RepID=UPI003B778F8F
MGCCNSTEQSPYQGAFSVPSSTSNIAAGAAPVPTHSTYASGSAISIPPAPSGTSNANSLAHLRRYSRDNRHPRLGRTSSERRHLHLAAVTTAVNTDSIEAPEIVFNQPLRRKRWKSRAGQQWTTARIDLCRQEFFETRDDGRPEIWQSLRAALELLWVSDRAQETGRLREIAMSTAQSIIDAAGITIPTGNPSHGVYDSRGHLYQLPREIICDPQDIIQAEGVISDRNSVTTAEEEEAEASFIQDEQAKKGALDSNNLSSTTNSVAASAAAAASASVMTLSLIKLTVRLSQGAQDVVVEASLAEPIRTIKKTIAAKAQLLPDRHVRLVYMGKVLPDRDSLEKIGWQPGHVVNAMICKKPDSTL